MMGKPEWQGHRGRYRIPHIMNYNLSSRILGKISYPLLMIESRMTSFITYFTLYFFVKFILYILRLIVL